MSTQDPPFKLPLKPATYSSAIVSNDGEHVAMAYGNAGLQDARRDYIALCVNAHDKLVARIAKLEGACAAIGYANELSAAAIADLCRDALGLADPAAEDQP